MIPKIIHYTWFSGEEMPDNLIQCMKSWKKQNPDYTIKLWDMSSIQNIDSVFVKEAISLKKWAYAADYVRLWAIYNEGGIYVDTDCMLYNSFDSFLNERVFIGKENSIHFLDNIPAQFLSSHCFGAEKKHPYIKDCLSYYENRHFITSTNQKLPIPLRLNYVLLPYIQAEIARLYGYDWKPLNQTIQHCREGITIYPTEYFDTIEKKSHAICQHLALGSWREEKPKEPIYNLKYKLQWRFLFVLQYILKKFNYITLKID